MFNSPILDVTIGLVFIFLLYSLLVTSINEAIASVFALRARMLRNAIVDRMFSRHEPGTRWGSIKKGVGEFYQEAAKIIKGTRMTKVPRKYGDQFYEHPLIKNYGSSRVFDLPSYIPARNFSTVVIDILKADYETKKDSITIFKNELYPAEDPSFRGNPLVQNADILKIRDLIEYYSNNPIEFKEGNQLNGINSDTQKILHMLLVESKYNLEQFTLKLEAWFDDTMNRVSGWYKRQTQTILFILGLSIASILNVDTIEMAGRLSTDDEARERLVQLAIQSADKYKDDPRVKKMVTQNGNVVPDTSAQSIAANEDIFKTYQARLDSIKNLVKGDIQKSSNILALGWDNANENEKNEGGFWSKLLGFLITAFAISLGAPFWFDVLNKLIKLRSSGKKEGEDETTGKANAPQPLTLNINSNVGDKAVG